MIFKCKMCGGDIAAAEGAVLGTCDSCGVTSTLPKAADEKLVNLFNRANHFRRLNEFDRAMGAYESILTEDNTNAEAHWCVALCRYGIEYVEDPKTGKHVPTCHRASHEPIVTDADYLSALEYAEDGYARELYETEAKKINEIQKNILAISSREEPFDVFICYKETTDGGSRTKDSVIAQDIHDALVKEGLRVFFARITLENILGAQYEPYIFGALNTAKVMLVIGTRKEHFEAVWVRNEWSRFLALMKKDRAKTIVPCYRDMDAYDMPEELSMYQSQDMGKIGFAQDLLRGVKKIIDAGKKKEAPAATSAAASQGAGATVDSLLKRVFMFLADGDFTQAAQYAEKVLDVDPENARAYVGLLCAEMKLRKIEDLEYCDSSIGNISTYKNAVRFADQELRTELQIYEDKILKRLELKRQEKRKAEAEAISNLEQKLALLTNQGLEKIKRNFNIALALQLACYPIVIILSVIMLGANFYRFKLTLGYICFLLIPFIFASFTWFFKRKAQQQKKVDMLEYSAVMPFGSVAFCIWYNLWVTQILDWSGYYYSYIHQVIAIVLIPILILVMIIMGIRKIIKSKITIQRNQIIKEISRLKTGLLTE